MRNCVVCCVIRVSRANFKSLCQKIFKLVLQNIITPYREAERGQFQRCQQPRQYP